MRTISTQAEWEQVRDRYPRASDYRAFSAEFTFDPSSKIELTGQSLAEALPQAKPGGPRWTIFKEAIQSGRTVESVNGLAKQVARRLGASAEMDGDVFIALRTGYVTLESSGV